MCLCNLYIAQSYAKSLERINQISRYLPEDFENAVSVYKGEKRFKSKNFRELFHWPWWKQGNFAFLRRRGKQISKILNTVIFY